MLRLQVTYQNLITKIIKKNVLKVVHFIFFVKKKIEKNSYKQLFYRWKVEIHMCYFVYVMNSQCCKTCKKNIAFPYYLQLFPKIKILSIKSNTKTGVKQFFNVQSQSSITIFFVKCMCRGKRCQESISVLQLK